MKKLLGVMLLVAGISTGVSLDETVQAQSNFSFQCRKNSQNTWTTFVTRKDGSQSQFIKWLQDDLVLAGYPPERRCREVTGRLNVLANKGGKPKLTYGSINRIPVICVTDRKGGSCQSLLYTLKPKQDPEETLRNLMLLNKSKFNGPALVESASCRIYVDVEAVVQGKSKTAEVACIQ